MRFEGCFYASGSVRQLDKGGKPWQGLLKYKDAEGKWHQVTKMLTDATGKRDAERLLCEWQEAMERRAAASVVKDAKDIKKSVGASVVDEARAYLDEEFETGVIERSTYSMQRRALTQQIAPYFGGIRFEELRKSQVKAWVAAQLEKYAQATVEVQFAVLAKTYKNAIAEDRITYNPCEGVKVRKPLSKKEINTLSERGVAEFVEAVASSQMEPRRKAAHLLALYTGMRAQEICGLRWRDVSQPKATISIRIVIGKDELKHEEYVKVPKSKAGCRTIPMLPEVAEVLKQLYESQFDEYKSTHPEAFELPADFFCTGPDCGERWDSPPRLSHTLLQFCERNEIVGTSGRPITPHALRHTFATMGVAAGVDIKSLSSILGHAKASMTLDIYAKADANATRAGMERLGQYMEEKTETGAYSAF